MFVAMDIDARRIWLVIPYFSDSGKFFVAV